MKVNIIPGKTIPEEGTRLITIRPDFWIMVDVDGIPLSVVANEPWSFGQVCVVAKELAHEYDLAIVGRLQGSQWYGDISLVGNKMGSIIWTAEDGLGMRAREDHETFSCGIDCCGIRNPAIVAIDIDMLLAIKL